MTAQEKPVYWGAKNKSPRQKAHNKKFVKKTRKEVMLSRAKKLNRWWPGLFDPEDIKPLKVGIDADLLADALRRGLDLDINFLNKFMPRWTRFHRYLKAIERGEYRYGLNGEQIPLTEDDKAGATGWLAEAKRARAAAYEKGRKV